MTGYFWMYWQNPNFPPSSHEKTCLNSEVPQEKKRLIGSRHRRRKKRDWNRPLSRIDHYELIKCILFYLKSVLIEVIVRENFICVKNGMLEKQLAINEIPREMNTAEY